MGNCIFCGIVNKNVHASIVYEDTGYIAFKDTNPQAPEHIVIIPKVHVESMDSVKDFSIYAGIFEVISKLVEKPVIKENGYRVVVNCNKYGGQSVFHLHFHLLGGRPMKWPPG